MKHLSIAKYFLLLVLLAACNLEKTTSITQTPPTQAIIAPTNITATARQPTQPPAQSCPDLVENAIAQTGQICDSIERNQICYGNRDIVSAFVDETPSQQFQQAGDMADITQVTSLRLSGMNLVDNIWGIALMRVQTDLLSSESTTFLMFGDTDMQNTSNNSSSIINTFHFTSGADDAACTDAPESGLLIQTPSGSGTIDFLINEVVIRVGSTLYIQAQPLGVMNIRVLEGQARVTAKGVTQTITTGYHTMIPLDADGLPDGSPSVPIPYPLSSVLQLPISLLPEFIRLDSVNERVTPTVTATQAPIGSMPFVANFDGNNPLQGWDYDRTAWTIAAGDNTRVLEGIASPDSLAIVLGLEKPEWLGVRDFELSFRVNIGAATGTRIIFKLNRGEGYNALDIREGMVLLERNNSLHSINLPTNFRSINTDVRLASTDVPVTINEWNDFTVQVQGRQLKVFFNGKLVIDAVDSNPPFLNAGEIALQNSTASASMRFDDIVIRHLE